MNDSSQESKLRRLLDDFADQLCPAVDGKFDFRVRIEEEDEHLQKLQMLTNFLLDAADSSISELELRNEENLYSLHALREAEARTRESEARLRAIIDSASDAIITIDERGVIESANKTAGRIFGYTEEELVGKNVKMLMPSPYTDEHDSYIARYLDTGNPKVIGRHREVVALRKDGTTIAVDLGITEVRVEKGRRFMGLVRDITERKSLETQLSHAQKMESIGQLASGIAHEINTPAQYLEGNLSFLEGAFGKLNGFLRKTTELLEVLRADRDPGAVLGELDDIEKGAKLDYLLAEIPDALQQSHDGVRRISEIVLAMKEFSHPGDAKKALTDLNKLIQNTITVTRNEWKYVAQIDTNLSGDLPPVPCLAGDLSQAFLNIIVNAAHAISEVIGDNASENGTISISTSLADGSVRVEIADTGSGIPEELRSRIFDPFFTTKEVGKGTGQGLAIAHSIVVDKHRGTIACDSKPGEGTKFTIHLPLDDIGSTEARAN